MKRILFVFLTFCPLFSFAQNSEEKNKNDSIGFQLSPFEITHWHILGGEHWYKDNESERTTFFTISSLSELITNIHFVIPLSSIQA
ncbi:MAG: hypothetical protein ACXVDZ_11965 [Bacteroidia bacterium]